MSRSKPRSVTMDDVARHLGLSRTTVSFVLSDRPDANIPAETRQRVWDAVRELGYRPNAAAKSLASQQTHLIGLVTDIVTTPFAGEIIKGAQQQAWTSGKLLLIVSTEGDRSIEAAAFEMLLERRVEGILYATTWNRAVTLPASAREVPTVLVNCFDVERTYPSIIPDEIQGGRDATERLVAAGHRRIALINLDPTIPAAVGRRTGYEAALRAAGIAVDDALVVSGLATADGGFARARDLLDLPDPPSAIFCANDRMAMGAYDAVKERGLRIPDDVALVGFDNQEIIAAYLRPGLTTVALPFQEMGAAAVARLTSLTRSDQLADQHLVLCPLIERSSV
ncbi:LacI family DNA-binding transcriptional regulator [Pengzhenrongella phosphoraccumulans]|uniref:LacI family DNA-binding transcriptional regulator n=1 Tax=Pengzhenrongella phosphoraccumulans TaxID=3114394 RepID=UPI00388E06EE